MVDDALSPGPILPQGKLLEGVVTTLNDNGSPHLAPMGPIVDADFERLLLRPFRTSVTYQNLKRSEQGVLHVTDDVELIAHAAVGRLESLPPLRAAAMQRCSTATTRQPRAAAICAVASVEPLSATSISTAPGRQRPRASSMLSSRRGNNAASL